MLHAQQNICGDAEENDQWFSKPISRTGSRLHRLIADSLPAIRRMPIPFPGVTPKAIRLAQRSDANGCEELQVTRLPAAILFPIQLAVHFFPHRKDPETSARHGADPLKNVSRLQQTAFPLIGLDLQLANLNPNDLAVDVAFQQQFFFALPQFR